MLEFCELNPNEERSRVLEDDISPKERLLLIAIQLFCFAAPIILAVLLILYDLEVLCGF